MSVRNLKKLVKDTFDERYIDRSNLQFEVFLEKWTFLKDKRAFIMEFKELEKKSNLEYLKLRIKRNLPGKILINNLKYSRTQYI